MCVVVIVVVHGKEMHAVEMDVLREYYRGAVPDIEVGGDGGARAEVGRASAFNEAG